RQRDRRALADHLQAIRCVADHDRTRDIGRVELPERLSVIVRGNLEEAEASLGGDVENVPLTGLVPLLGLAAEDNPVAERVRAVDRIGFGLQGEVLELPPFGGVEGPFLVITQQGDVVLVLRGVIGAVIVGLRGVVDVPVAPVGPITADRRGRRARGGRLRRGRGRRLRRRGGPRGGAGGPSGGGGGAGGAGSPPRRA